MGGEKRPRLGLFLAGSTYAYQAEIIYGAHEECERQGFDLFCLTGGRLSGEDPRSYAYDIASPRDLDGAILVPGTWGAAMESDPVQALLRRYTQSRTCVIGARWQDTPSVCVDNSTGVQELTRHLIEVHGRRRIAFICGRGLEANERLRGYEQGLRAAGLEPDPALIYAGDYSFDAGRKAAAGWCTADLLHCDAIVAANDWMAAGALDLMQERGVRVPEDVSLVGFDDIDRASFMSPPLTTVRQPPRYLGSEAVALIAALLQGTLTERHVSVQTFTQIRRSCGCFGHASALRSVEPASSPVLESFSDARPRITASLGGVAAHLARGFSQSWASELVEALGRDLSAGSDHLFLQCLHELLAESVQHGNVTAWHHVISHLREKSVSVLAGNVATLVRAETLFGRAYIAIGEQAELAQGRRLIEREEVMLKLEDVSRYARTALDWPAVCRVLCDHLPRLRIPSCHVAEGNGGADADSRQVFAFENGEQKPLPPEGIVFRTSQIIAPALQSSARTTWIVHPMFMQHEIMGHCCYEIGPRNGAVFETFGNLTSSALKASRMSAALIEEVTRREGAERARMRQELDIAARIQSAILPKHPQVVGLELAALMRPATEVGGDYFDVQPCPGGCWIGIGDVAGHGLTAGLVMLMIQSIVAATVHERPSLGPGRAWKALNEVLSENIRERMGQEEHATLCLIRYERSGRLTFSGAHEDLLVYKPASKRCERIATPGIWVGIGADLPPEATEERSYQLEPGDVLVLYTDGIVEARSRTGEVYGNERLEQMIVRHGDLPAAELCDRVVEDVGGWMGAQDDDITLLVARHIGEDA